ncbi:MAG: hybrid sensor histidine kinase/response regulator [Candidatus Anammoxibacter sp.]
MLNETRPTILCVDDEPLVLDVLSDIFEPEYHVKTTVSCKEALKMCCEHEIEVIIADQNMPEMDGTEFFVQANKLNPICKRLLLTGFDETDTVKNAIKFGVVDEFVRKPCNADEIRKTVDLLLNNYSLHKYKIYTKCLGNSASDKQSILVVDDDPVFLKILNTIFGVKYRVYTAQDANVALNIMNGNQVNLVISDHIMPDISGVELLEIITEKYPYVGRILMTACDDMSKVLEDAVNKKIIDKFVHKSDKTNLINFVHDVLIDKEKEAIKNQFSDAKIASIRQLAAGISHEINNPLAFVDSNLGNIKKYLNTFSRFIERIDNLAFTEELKIEIEKLKEEANYSYIKTRIIDLVEKSLIGAKRIRNTVMTLKEFTGVDAAEIALVNINETINSVLELVFYDCKNKINIKKAYCKNNPEITCAVSKLNLVFYNILTNACQSIKGSGTLSIKTFKENDNVVVDIWNDGPIIPESIVDRIFDPFFTTRPLGHGTGVGLFTCNDIMRQMRGKLSVKSEIDFGTCFTIKLPTC